MCVCVCVCVCVCLHIQSTVDKSILYLLYLGLRWSKSNTDVLVFRSNYVNLYGRCILRQAPINIIM